MTFRESYRRLSSASKQFIDQLNGTNDQRNAEKLSNQFLSITLTERFAIAKMYEYLPIEIAELSTILIKWDFSIKYSNKKEFLAAQKKLLERDYIKRLVYTIDDNAIKLYEQVLKYKNYLESSRLDFALIGVEYLNNSKIKATSRGGKSDNAGRKSTWPSKCKFADTKLIRVPKYIAEELIVIAKKLDSKNIGNFKNKNNQQLVKNKNDCMPSYIDYLDLVMDTWDASVN